MFRLITLFLDFLNGGCKAFGDSLWSGFFQCRNFFDAHTLGAKHPQVAELGFC